MSLLLDDVSIVVTPNGYKAGTLYGVLPTYAEGSEEIENGTFVTSDLSDFATTYAEHEIVSEELKTTLNTANGYGLSRFRFTAEIGKRYRILASCKQGTSDGTVVKSHLGITVTNSGVNTGDWSYDEIGVATDTTCWVRLQVQGDSGVYALFDNISVKEYTAADMDVTRATAATRVDEDGLVNYAEIIGSELVTNGDFELNSDWNNFSTPTTSEQSTEQSHTGTYSWKVIADATQEGIFSPNNFSITNGNSYSVSLWIYSVSGNSIKSGLNNTNVSVFTERTVIAGQWTNITYEATATSTGASYISILSQNSLNFYVDDVSVKEVTRDNVPRIDYTGGGCPHILAEPQRTNTLTYSEDFSQWSTSGTTPTFTTGQLSPSGEYNATKISGTIGSSLIYLGGSSSSTTATRTIYARTVSGTGTARLMSRHNNVNNLFTLTEEWTRFELTGSDSLGGGDFYIDFRDSSQTLSEFFVWGGQSEEATYATSYIPTSGSTVTRNQDIFTRDGISSLINSTEGVLFLEISAINDMESEQKITINNGGINELIEIYYRFGRIYGGVRVGGIVVASIFYTPIDKTLSYKCAVKWELNSVSFWVDGVKIGEDLSASTPIGLSKLSFDRGNGTLNFFGKVKQLQVYKTALTDEQLLQLTGESGTDFYESYAEMAAALTYTIQ